MMLRSSSSKSDIRMTSFPVIQRLPYPFPAKVFSRWRYGGFSLPQLNPLLPFPAPKDLQSLDPRCVARVPIRPAAGAFS
jgi:hypothetical protein